MQLKITYIYLNKELFKYDHCIPRILGSHLLILLQELSIIYFKGRVTEGKREREKELPSIV